MESEVLSSSSWDQVTGRVGMAQSCTKGGSNWTLGSISLPRGWSNTGTGFPEKVLMLQACQRLRGIWTMPLITRFNFWSALKWSGQQLDDHYRSLPTQIFYSILFYSILFYSILFYSILFYSILFHSIPFYSIPFHSILFYSILFYSILFYSILFYSILFYSILFFY